MAKNVSGKVTQEEYQKAILGDDPELLGSDDEGDLVDDEPVDRGKTKPQAVVEEDVEESDGDGDAGEADEEASSEPVYRKDQVQRIVQTRVNTYTKRVQKLQPYKEAVDKICEVTGLDFDQLVSRLTSMTDEEQAKILGMTVDQVKAARSSRQEIIKERGKNQTLSRQLEETQLKADTRFSDYDLYKDEIDDLIEDNPKLSLKQAYMLAKGESALHTAARDGEQRAVAKRVKEAQGKSVVKSSSGLTQSGPKLDAAIVSAAKKIGMDPAEYAAYQGVDNIDAYRAMKAKKKS